MLSHFHFSEFEPEDSLRSEAGQNLDEILELAPEGTIAIAKLDIEEDGYYRCAIDLYSKHGPLIARTRQLTPFLAIDHARKILEEKLRRFRSAKRQTQPVTIEDSSLFL